MKIRTGFVSNSSSSSFICDITGNCFSGMNAELADSDMYMCANGHTFQEEFLIGEVEEVDENDPRVVSFHHCPLCQLKEFKVQDLLGYACKKLNMSIDELKQEISTKYHSCGELERDIPKYGLFTQCSGD